MSITKTTNIFLKMLLAGLLVYVIYFSYPPQYRGKAVVLRVIFYQLAAALTYVNLVAE